MVKKLYSVILYINIDVTTTLRHSSQLRCRIFTTHDLQPWESYMISMFSHVHPKSTKMRYTTIWYIGNSTNPQMSCVMAKHFPSAYCNLRHHSWSKTIHIVGNPNREMTLPKNFCWKYKYLYMASWLTTFQPATEQTQLPFLSNDLQMFVCLYWFPVNGVGIWYWCWNLYAYAYVYFCLGVVSPFVLYHTFTLHWCPCCEWFCARLFVNVQIQFTDVYMHVSIHRTQHTKNDVCIYVWHIYLWQNRNRQSTLLSVFAVSRSLRIPSNASPIPPRSNRSAMAAAMNRMSKKFQYLTNRFCSHQGYEAELRLDEGTNMIKMMCLYNLWAKILDSLNWWRPKILSNHSISGVSKDPVRCCERKAGSKEIPNLKTSLESIHVHELLLNLLYLTKAKGISRTKVFMGWSSMYFFGTWEKPCQ